MMISVVILYIISPVTSQTTLTCTSGEACTYDCGTYDCQNAIIRAEDATSLSVTNCGVVSKYCEGLNIYCPLYNAFGDSQNTCNVSGVASNTIKNVEIFAQNAWYDVFVDNALELIAASGGSIMHCGADTLTYSCKFGAGGADNNQCAAAEADKTCDSFIMTRFPTTNPTTNPSMQPSMSPTRNPIQAVVLSCVANENCAFDCNVDDCRLATIRAEIASTLTVTNCGKQANNCDDLTVYCPQYNAQIHAAGTCVINGGSNNPVSNLHIFAQDGFYDVEVLTDIDLVSGSGTQMHCGGDADTNAYTCYFGAGGLDNDVCETSAADKTCETYQMTLNPTSNPTYYPTAIPTTNPSTNPTSNPTFNPTAIPTANPTFNPTAIPTATTAPPTFEPTINPTIYPSTNPTKMPSTNPTITPTQNPSTSPSVHPSSVPSISPTRRPTMEQEFEESTTSNTSDGDEQGVQSGSGPQNGFVIPLVVALSIVAVIFFLGAAYWIVVKKRKLEEEYGAEFRRAASEMIEMEMVCHTIPADNLSRPPTASTQPKQQRPPRTVTMSGEHMEYNEVYGSPREAVVPLEEENENGYAFGFDAGNEENENRRLFYQAQFMQMMMEDQQQQAYLLRLDTVQRRQYIQYQTNLYLARVEDMARKKTLPIYDDAAAPETDAEEGTSDESVEGEVVETMRGDIGDMLLDLDMDESVDNIQANVDESDHEESDQSILATIENTKGMIVDLEPDSCFD